MRLSCDGCLLRPSSTQLVGCRGGWVCAAERYFLALEPSIKWPEIRVLWSNTKGPLKPIHSKQFMFRLLNERQLRQALRQSGYFSPPAPGPLSESQPMETNMHSGCWC